MNKLVEILCDADDFCWVFIPEWEKQLLADASIKIKRPCLMAMSEIMTIIISFHTSNHRVYKNYYKSYISKFEKAYFLIYKLSNESCGVYLAHIRSS